MNFNEMCEIIRKHNQENNIKQQYSDKNALKCRVVISNDTWKRFNMSYSLESRTYEFRSDEKYFCRLWVAIQYSLIRSTELITFD